MSIKEIGIQALRSGQAAGTDTDITLNVTPGAPSPLPQPLILRGDRSANPYISINDAVSVLPRTISDTVTINLAASTTHAAATLEGFDGGGTIHLKGAASLVTPTTGLNTGTLDGGTSGTNLNDTSGAWTVSDSVFRSALVLITSGTATGVYRPIIGNDATNLTVRNIVGVASGDTYQIVRPNAVVDLTIKNCKCTIKIDLCDAKITATDSVLTIVNSENSNGAITAANCRVAVADSKILSGLSATGCLNVVLTRTSAQAAAVVIDGCARANIAHEAQAAATSALQFVDCDIVDCDLEANGNTATPLHVRAVKNFRISGLGIVGTNAGAPYGMDVGGQTSTECTGITISGGTNDLFFEGTAYAWTYFNAAESVSNLDSVFVKQGGPTKRVIGEAILLNGDFQVVGGAGHYGKLYFAPFAPSGASLGITAFAGGGQGSAVVLGVGLSTITTVATIGDSVRVPGAPAFAGWTMLIRNEGANACNLFPQSGGKINALATDAAYSIPAGSGIIIAGVNATDWAIFGVS